MSSELSPFGWAPGNYWFVCRDCRKKQCVGSKRSWRCEDCAKVAAAKWNQPDTRPAPAATDTGLETVLWGNERSLSQPHDPVVWERVTASYPRPYYNVELVRRSQAEDLLAAKDTEIKACRENINIKADFIEKTVGQLHEAELAAERAEKDGWKELHDAAQVAVKERTEACNNLYKQVNDLKADNAAKDARIKELDHENNCWMKSAIKQQKRSKALEAKLAAAQEALEPFALISSEGVIKQETGHVTVITCAEYFHKARAVLGGKPS